MIQNQTINLKRCPGHPVLQIILIAQVLVPALRDQLWARPLRTQKINITVNESMIYLPSAIFHHSTIDRGADRGSLPARLEKRVSFITAETGIESHLRLPIIGVVRAVGRIDIRVLFIEHVRKKPSDSLQEI